jgi:DNA-binding helix-hairpin-helix protein with protein kinase domain
MRDELYELMNNNNGDYAEQEDAFENAYMTRLNICETRLSNAPVAQNSEYSYEWYLQQFEEASARVAGVQGECTPSALSRALRSESRNLLVDLNNEDRAAYEADPRRQNMIRAYNEVLGRCEADPFNNMVQARQAVQNV